VVGGHVKAGTVWRAPARRGTNRHAGRVLGESPSRALRSLFGCARKQLAACEGPSATMHPPPRGQAAVPNHARRGAAPGPEMNATPTDSARPSALRQSRTNGVDTSIVPAPLTLRALLAVLLSVDAGVSVDLE
jgi:hypothetical protein